MYLNCGLKGSLSNRNATSVLQRRKLRKIEKEKKKQKQNNPITWKATVIVRSNLL